MSIGRTHGFTLIELVVTVAIVAVLASIALPLAELAVKRTNDQYKGAVDQGRVRRSRDKSGYPPTLRELVDGVEDARSPDKKKIYFLRRIPRDPMSPDTTVAAEATWGLRSYASPPEEPRDGDDVYDVYSRSDGIGLNGVAYRQW